MLNQGKAKEVADAAPKAAVKAKTTRKPRARKTAAAAA